MLRTLCDGHGGNGPSDADDDLKPEAWDECRAGCLDTALMGILTIPANLIGGKMADRFNKKMNIVYLDMISVISYIICGLIPLTTKSIVLMFIASTCQNMENPSYNSLTADITLSKDRERGYSLQYLTANLGGVMASAVAGFMFRNYLWFAFLLSGISIGTSSVMIYFFVQNITPEKEESDGNAIYQAERHGESLLTILKENRLVLLFILITSGYTALTRCIIISFLWI